MRAETRGFRWARSFLVGMAMMRISLGRLVLAGVACSALLALKGCGPALLHPRAAAARRTRPVESPAPAAVSPVASDANPAPTAPESTPPAPAPEPEPE